MDNKMISYSMMNHGSICELKAVDSLIGQHDSQVLNYLLLADLQFGKLINFSSPSVQYRFVTTTLNSTDRMNYKIDETFWLSKVSSGNLIRDILYRLLAEWGVFLDVNLYRDALFYLLGGRDSLHRSVNVFVGGQAVGTQKLCCLDEETCLHISSTIRHFDTYRKQLLKLFDHTNLKHIQWINFNRAIVQMITLKK
jgi:hypothetical protein